MGVIRVRQGERRRGHGTLPDEGGNQWASSEFISESASGHGTLPDAGGNQYLMREAINGRHQSSSSESAVAGTVRYRRLRQLRHGIEECTREGAPSCEEARGV